MASPKTLNDFKKASKNNTQNTILNPNKAQTAGAMNAAPLDDILPTMQQSQPMNYQETPMPEFMQMQNQGAPAQAEFPQNFKPNFDSAFKQADSMEIPLPDTREGNNTSFDNRGEMQQPFPKQQAFSQQPFETQQAQPKQTMKEKEYNQQYMQPREEYKPQPYQQIQPSHTEKKQATPNNKSLVSHMQEVEAEIDGLVNNTQIFLNNTKELKLQILEAKDKEELEGIMREVKATLEDIPQSFIDAETRRKIRLCFSYLHNTKKELLDAAEKIKQAEMGLKNLVAIDSVPELEEVILDMAADQTAANVYEIRTFEINLVNQLPIIKEEMLREKMLATYNG